MWAMVVGGVPLGQTKVLWELDPGVSMEYMLYAAEEYNFAVNEGTE